MSSPNVLLVTVDSLRADHVNGERADTPSLDRLTRRGSACDVAVVQGPFTTFSMPSIFTSRYPSQLTGIDFVEGVQGVLVGDTPTLQQRLAANGYTTAGIHSNPLLSHLFGFDTGFDYFEDGVQDVTGWIPERLRLLANKCRRLVSRTAYTPAEKLTDAALDWLADSPDEPWFLWVHYMDVHGPYQSSHGASYLEKFRAEWLWRRAVHAPEQISASEHARLRSSYVDEVEYTDTEIGRLFDGVREVAEEDEICIVVTADHGEEFGEHDSYSHESKLYEELLRVPLIVDAPERVEIAFRDGPTPLLDLAPTVVDLGGGTMAEAEGRSLVARDGLGDGAHEPEGGVEKRAVIAEARLPPTYTACVRTADWKYITGPSSSALYHLGADPEETTDAATDYPAVVEDLDTRLSAHRDRCVGSGADVDGVALDSDEIDDRLRQLGYLE